MFRGKNILILGVSLLLIFAVAVWLVGIGIDRAAGRMRSSMVDEVGRYRADLIALDFYRTVELTEGVEEYISKNPDNETGLQNLLMGLVKLDAKISRVWYKKEDENFVFIDSLSVRQPDAVVRTSLEKITAESGNCRRGCLYYCEGILYWTLINCMQGIVMGVDVSLPGLHAYFASMNPAVRSYAYVLNEKGICLVHPDENKIGRHLTDDDQVAKPFLEAISRNRVVHASGVSSFLLVPVERVYYPINVGPAHWVVVVNVPDLVTQDEMDRFHWYTVMIVVLTVLLFAILLAFSQYRWRKEYDRRVKLEQETLQLNMQQLKNQVNPHFLFNALNSLNVLISNQPLLAKEFVLNLSRIYRYVLEKRHDNLASVRDEIDFIRHYYFLQKIRFQDQLNLDIAERLEEEERTIPVMSLQMLIENAIKHNEITRQHPLYIHIYLKDACLIVENNYCPRSDTSENSLGVGFESIQKIYAYCSDKQFEYRIEENHFICVLPLI